MEGGCHRLNTREHLRRLRNGEHHEQSVSLRTLAAGAFWAVPAVSVATAVPAFAASVCAEIPAFTAANWGSLADNLNDQYPGIDDNAFDGSVTLKFWKDAKVGGGAAYLYALAPIALNREVTYTLTVSARTQFGFGDDCHETKWTKADVFLTDTKPTDTNVGTVQPIAGGGRARFVSQPNVDANYTHAPGFMPTTDAGNLCNPLPGATRPEGEKITKEGGVGFGGWVTDGASYTLSAESEGYLVVKFEVPFDGKTGDAAGTSNDDFELQFSITCA